MAVARGVWPRSVDSGCSGCQGVEIVGVVVAKGCGQEWR